METSLAEKTLPSSVDEFQSNGNRLGCNAKVIKIANAHSRAIYKIMNRYVRQFLALPSRLERVMMLRRLKNSSFSIISNNCWGGQVYQDLGLPYASPFVGMFLYAEDFVILASSFDSIDLVNLTFSDKTRHRSAAKYREKNRLQYPIGVIGDGIEIHFLHYQTAQEAEIKWKRRCKRLNRDNLFFKFNDQNECSSHHIEAFGRLPYPNKVCFAAKPYPGIQSVIFLPEFKLASHVGNDEVFIYKRHFDPVGWLNGQHNSRRGWVESLAGCADIFLRQARSHFYNARGFVPGKTM
jgi:uncharacterized protein (DUF1919 family)